MILPSGDLVRMFDLEQLPGDDALPYKPYPDT